MEYKVLSANFLYEKLDGINVGDNIPEDRLRDIVDKSVIKFLTESKAIEEVLPIYVEGENFFAVEPIDVGSCFDVEEPMDAVSELENQDYRVNLDTLIRWFIFDFKSYLLENKITVPDYEDFKVLQGYSILSADSSTFVSVSMEKLAFDYENIIKSLGYFNSIANFKRDEEIETGKKVVLYFLEKDIDKRVGKDGDELLDHENLDGTFDEKSYLENINQFDLKTEYLSFLEVLKCFAPKYVYGNPVNFVARIDRLKNNVKARKTFIIKKSDCDWEVNFLD